MSCHYTLTLLAGQPMGSDYFGEENDEDVTLPYGKEKNEH